MPRCPTLVALCAWRRRRVEKAAAERELGGAMAVGEEAIVADAMEAVRQRVQQEPADELVCREGHDLRAAVVAIIPPAESHVLVCDADQAGVGDRNTMSVAPEIGQHLLRAAEGRLGVNDPFDAV